MSINKDDFERSIYELRFQFVKYFEEIPEEYQVAIDDVLTEYGHYLKPDITEYNDKYANLIAFINEIYSQLSDIPFFNFSNYDLNDTKQLNDDVLELYEYVRDFIKANDH